MKYTDAKQIITKFGELKGRRANWESVWQELADYINPRKNDILTTNVPGQKKFQEILDSTAVTSGELLAGALHGMLTNPAGYFFNLSTGDVGLDQQDSVRMWIQEVVRILHNTLNNSNFQTEVHEYYIDLVDFGMGNLWAEEDPKFDIRFMANPIRDIYVGENRHGMIDTVFRHFKYTVKDMIQEFGEDKVPAKLIKEYKDGKETKYEMIHAVYPNIKLKGDKGPLSTFNFISQYVIVAEQHIIKEGGFRELPYIIGRWTKASGEEYGRGPGEKALPDTKLVNIMKETTIRSAQKSIDPPLQAPDDGFVFPLITAPAGINFYRSGSNDRIEPIFNVQRIDFGIELVNEVRQAIREAFYVDQLQLRQGPQMTATEVMERTEQALRFLGPMLARQQAEFLQPLVERAYRILERRDKLPELPVELEGVPIVVKYSSVMAMTQRMSEAQNIQRTMGAISPFIQMDPNSMDNLDADRSVRYLAQLFNFPQEMLRDVEEIGEIREQRAQAQQEAAEAQNQLTEAETVNKLASATQ
jgi:hypothetical protein